MHESAKNIIGYLETLRCKCYGNAVRLVGAMCPNDGLGKYRALYLHGATGPWVSRYSNWVDVPSLRGPVVATHKWNDLFS